MSWLKIARGRDILEAINKEVFAMYHVIKRCGFSTAAVLFLISFAAAANARAAGGAVGLSDSEVAQGFVAIFDGKSLNGWVGLNGDTSSYYVKDNMLICKATGNVPIFSRSEYANFILRLQIKMDPGGNNGIGIRTKINRAPHLWGMEIQVLDDGYYEDGDPIKLKDYQHHGSIYGVVPAKTGHLKPAGQWNDEEIICDGRRVTVTLNGVVIVDADLDQVRPVGPRGTSRSALHQRPHRPARARQLRGRSLVSEPAGQAARLDAVSH